MAKHPVALLDDFTPGTRRLVQVGERRIAVFNVGGCFYAIADRCPHEGGSLFQGKLAGLVRSTSPGEYVYSRPSEVVRCPWHSWEFDLATGRSVCNPRRVRVKNYPVGVANADQFQDELAAETFTVAVEGACVYLDL